MQAEQPGLIAPAPESPRRDAPAPVPALADRVLHRWPLRYSVPIVLAIGACLALAITLVWSVLVVATSVARTERNELRTDVRAAAGTLERHRTRGFADAAEDAVALLAADPRTTHAAVLDGEGRVIAAHPTGLVGRLATDPAGLGLGAADAAVARVVGTGARGGADAVPVAGAPGDVLVAAAPAPLPDETDAATGALLVVRDVTDRIRDERGVVLRAIVPLVAIMFASTVLLWFVFDLVVGRPLARLAEGARRLASGERGVQAGVTGTDEVGRLGTAFDVMAAEIDARVDRRDADLAVVEDRERIARDLHDHVIQRLFATGLGLQATSSRVDEVSAERLRGAVAELDDTIREIRTTIFGLHRHEQGVRADVLDVVAEYREVLGFLPETHFEGSVDTLVDEELQDNLVATVREALSNVARHARARRCRVTVRAGDRVEVEVVDDGVGLPPVIVRASGLRNLEERARELGGELELRAASPTGTVLHWHVPAPRPEPAGTH